jgi:hypothetical protein
VVLNTGTCKWVADVQLVYVPVAYNPTADILDQMSGPDAQPLGAIVLVGEQISISVALTAPLAFGQYAGYWMLRNTAGGRFGEGLRGGDAFSVTILLHLPVPTSKPPTATSQPTLHPSQTPSIIATTEATAIIPTDPLPTEASPLTPTEAPTDTPTQS